MAKAISVQKLRKAFDEVIAVDGLSFGVDRGDIFGLLGPNGAGKTTTIRMLMDIIKPDSGTVKILGDTPEAVRGRLGYLPEERGLYRDLRVDECLIYLAELKGVAHAVAAERAAKWLQRVDLAEWGRHKVHELSRGMQQKVQLIASFLHDPELIILDEPFQGLDPVNVETVKDIIRELHRAGKTVILSAHEMNQVEVLCDRIALIDHGRAVLYGELAEIKQKFSPNAIEISPPLNLDGWPEVARVEVRDGTQMVYLQPQSNPHLFMRKVLEQGLPVDRFERASMPLDQIFIQVVTGEAGHLSSDAPL